jgi:DNA repair exonuclease SbcCD ATPase subunit
LRYLNRMKNKKLSELVRDLRLVTSRSSHFGAEKSLWKKYRKYIIGGAVGGTALAAAGGAAYMMNQRKGNGSVNKSVIIDPEQEKNARLNLKRDQNIQQRELNHQLKRQQEIENAYHEGYRVFTMNLEKNDKLRYLRCKTQEKMSNQGDPSKQSECVKAGLKAREDKIRHYEDLEKQKMISASNAIKNIKARKEASINQTSSTLISNWRKRTNEIKEIIIKDESIMEEAKAIRDVEYSKGIHNGRSPEEATKAAEKVYNDFIYKQKKLQKEREKEMFEEERRQQYLESQQHLEDIRATRERLKREKHEKEQLLADIQKALQEKELSDAETARLQKELDQTVANVVQANDDLNRIQQEEQQVQQQVQQRAKLSSFGNRRKPKTLKQLKALCRTRGINLTVKRNGKRIPKSKKMLLKQLK